MKKNVNLCIDLKTVMQEDQMLNIGKCYRGCISRNSDDQYTFEEEATRHIDRHGHRNPKLFSGRYVSLVHMQNGKYQVHMRTINASDVKDHKELAANVYIELLNALKIID